MPSLLKISGNENKVIGGDGKLAAFFESADIPVTDTVGPAVAELPKVGAPQPSKAEVIRLGEEAMARLAEGRSWKDWIAVMHVLDIARTTAMLEANTNKPQGPRYREAIAKWFRLHPAFQAIHKTDRSRLHKCFDNLDAINDWRDNHVSPQQRLKLTYPPTVLSRWENWKKKQAEAGEDGEDESPPDPPPGPRLADIWLVSSEEEKQEVLDREGRAGLANLVSPSLLVDLVDHAVAQQIASGPNLKLKTYVQGTLTKIFWQIIGAAKEDDAPAVSAACAGLLRKCQVFNYDYRDFQITSPKKRAPKRG